MSSHLLALDIGTSSTRTALFDQSGNRLLASTAQEAYALDVTADGGAELSPSRLWTAVQHCWETTLDSTPEGEIMGVGVSCFWHSLLGVDAKGQPLTPIFTWADSRCRSSAAELRTQFSERAVHQRTGCMLRSSFWPAKLVWFRRTQPKRWAAVHRWLSPAEWIQEKFCGESLCSFSMASGTGLLDVTKLRWDPSVLAACQVSPERLNRLSDDSLPLSAVMRKRYPRLAKARWLPALGDGAASNLGSGATDDYVAAINFGTSGAVRVVRRQRPGLRAGFGLFCYCVDGQRRLIGGAISNAGNLRAWALRQLQLKESEIPYSALPGHGLTVLPFWAAERAPTWPEELPATIMGLNYHTSAVDIFHAVTEATYHRLGQIIETMEGLDSPKLTLVISGGITHSPAALQHMSNVLGRSLNVSPEPEASLRGAAVFAWEKLGVRLPPLPRGQTIRPAKAAAQAYARAREQQTALEKLLGNYRPPTPALSKTIGKDSVANSRPRRRA